MSTSFSIPNAEFFAPADTAAVAELVRKASEEGRAVYPRGGGTAWNYGLKPSKPGIVLSLEKLNRLIEHPADDMTVIVEAGMTFAELSQILATKKQELPIEVAHPDRATLGGLVAVNCPGPRYYGFKAIKDYLLGFTAVDGSGNIFQGGGRVVKNAAGYNLNRLMAGSLGTLAVLTQLTFLVRPLGTVRPQNAEPFSDSEKLETSLGETSPSETSLGDSSSLQHDAHSHVRLAVLPGRQSELIAALQHQWANRFCIAKANDGELYISLSCQPSEESVNEFVNTVRQLRKLTETFEGKMTVLSYPENVELTREDLWGPPGEGYRVMQSIKDRFDPKNILNPGRYIFS